MYRQILFDFIYKTSEGGWKREKANLIRFGISEIEVIKEGEKEDDKIIFKVDWENVFLLQSAGCFDKTGKTIFHGEILKDEEGRLFEVYLVNGSFFIVKDEEQIILSDNVVRRLDVVGNVIENGDMVAPTQEQLNEAVEKSLENNDKEELSLPKES